MNQLRRLRNAFGILHRLYSVLNEVVIPRCEACGHRIWPFQKSCLCINGRSFFIHDRCECERYLPQIWIRIEEEEKEDEGNERGGEMIWKKRGR